MSESVSGVDAIIDRLRNGPYAVGAGERYVTLAAAEAAVHAAASPADERLREAQDSDSTWPWPIAPDTVMPPRRQPVRWGSRADDPPTEIHDDPQRTKAYLAGLATGRAESRDRTEALRQIVDLPVVDDSDADRMREIADAALAGVSAEATPERGGVGAIDDGPVGQERSGESVVAPPPNPLNPYPFHEPLRVEHHSDEDKRQAWDEGYAAGVAVGQSLPSTGTGWDRGYAAGVAAERDQAWRWTIHVCPKGHKSLEPPLNGVCWKCWPGGRGPAEEHTAIRVAEVRR